LKNITIPISSECAYAHNGIESCKQELATIQKRLLILPRMTKLEADCYGERLAARAKKSERLKKSFERIVDRYIIDNFRI